MLKRDSEKYLEDWYARSSRKPLVIRGARQVGKSTLVRNVAASLSLELYEVNLERYPNLEDIFKKGDLEELLREIEFICKKDRINPGKSILFLDEIQSIPVAIKTLRYFYEDMPELPVIAAGSLLEFTLADHSYSMPVGRIEYFFMGPMTFEEFLQAKEEKKNLELIRNFNFGHTFPINAHTALCKTLRQYLLVGGMPEAVQRYVESNNFNEVIDVHASIIETYRDDFAKYARSRELGRIHRVFDYAPSAVGEKVKYSNIDENSQARDLRKAVDELAKANVINRVHHSKAAGIPLKAGKNDKVYKMYFLDVGLMNRVCGIQNIPAAETETGEFITEGKMAEQFIGQHLLYMGRRNETPQLFYWLREGRASNAEVDFVVQINNQLIPVEIKSGKSGSLKSLHRFVWEKKINRAVRFDLNPPSVMEVEHEVNYGKQAGKVHLQLLSLPLYMVDQLSRLYQLQSTN